MEQINPYAASQVSPVLQNGGGSSYGAVPVTPVALAAIIQTKIWVQIVGVVTFVVVALAVLSIIWGEDGLSGDLLSGPGNGAYNFGVIIGLLIVAGVLALHVILGIKLMKYGKAIERLAASNQPADFERAIDVQARFWKMAGIMTAVMLVIVLLIFGFGVVSGLSSY